MRKKKNTNASEKFIEMWTEPKRSNRSSRKLILENKVPGLVGKQNKMENIQNQVQTLINHLQEEQKVEERAGGATRNVSNFLGILNSAINIYLLQEREKTELKTQRDLLTEEIAQHVAVQETQKKSIEKLNGQLEAYHAIQEVVEKQRATEDAYSRLAQQIALRREPENKKPEEPFSEVEISWAEMKYAESETDSDDTDWEPEERRNQRNLESENKDATSEELECSSLHSVKDWLKHMGHNPKFFSNIDLAHIGRDMAANYRQTYNGRDPAKKEEKINNKHNSFVCVYGPADWVYLDKLIRETFCV